jgi:glycosyltransferase involved in cell wall biosynthesis
MTLPKASSAYQQLVEEIQPDLVHALRIPFEGMLASQTPERIPLLVAIWGNDLTLHAKRTLGMGRWTRSCLKRADGLSADTQRDLRLAKDWGFKPHAPTLVVPGSGGVDLAAIENAKSFEPKRYSIPESAVWIVNPRGLRPGSVHQKDFFTAIPKILAQRPEVLFICPGLKASNKAAGWVQSLGIGESTKLLPHLPQEELWSLMKSASIYVSPSSHDGTPNSFLEAMACGCFPIVGDIESLREWVQHKENGLLVDPKDPKALADAILWALAHPKIRESAAEINQTVIKEKAAQEQTRPKINAFYSKFL